MIAPKKRVWLAALASSAVIGGCWNSSCQRYYLIEDIYCAVPDGASDARESGADADASGGANDAEDAVTDASLDATPAD